MTVGELIKTLGDYPEDAQVLAYNLDEEDGTVVLSHVEPDSIEIDEPGLGEERIDLVIITGTDFDPDEEWG